MRILLTFIILLLTSGLNASALTTTPERKVIADRKVLDKEPSFREGDLNTFGKWLKGRTKIPRSVKRDLVEGPVMVSFIIDEQGSLTDVTVLKAVADDLAENFVKVLYKSPKWSPGIQDGKPVAVLYVYEMYFYIP